MCEKVYKYKVVSWIVGVLGGFALITGVGGLITTMAYIDSGSDNIRDMQLIESVIQIIFATLIIIGSILMYKKHIVGKKVLMISVTVLLGLVIVDALLYFGEDNNYLYILSSLLLQVVPLGILLFILKNISFSETINRVRLD